MSWIMRFLVAALAALSYSFLLLGDVSCRCPRFEDWVCVGGLDFAFERRRFTYLTLPSMVQFVTGEGLYHHSYGLYTYIPHLISHLFFMLGLYLI
ncbi:hypothetical protein V8F06_010325 [Rhypophila decipiens]